MNFYFKSPENLNSDTYTSGRSQLIDWIEQTKKKLDEDLENFIKSTPIKNKKYFDSILVIPNTVTGDIGSFPKNSDLSSYDYLKFLIMIVLTNHFTGKKTLSEVEKSNIVKLLPSDHDLSTLNENQFNNFFIGNTGVWELLNNNPGGFWVNLDEGIKNKISFSYAARKFLFDSLKSFKDFYAIKEPLSYELTFPSLGRADFSNIIENYDSKLRNKNPITSRKITYKDNFRESINSNLFFTLSQVTGIEEVSEGGPPYKLLQKDWDELVSLAKKDELFNVFEKDLLKGKNENSSIAKYLKNLITGVEDYALGTIVGAATSVKLLQRFVGEGGATTATDAEIEEFARDAESDFNSNISQCLLITDLANIGKHRKKLREDSKADVDYNKSNTWSYPYGGRIYCLDTDQDKSFLNCLNVPNGMNEFIKHTTKNDFKSHFKYNFSLYKVVEENGRALEYPYLFEGDIDATGKTPDATSFKFQNLKSLTKEELLKQVFIKSDVKSTEKNESKKIKISNVEISIEGDTPATVKSNIDVKITLTIPTLDAIQAIFEAKIKDPDNPNELINYEYSLVELLSYNIGQKYDGTQAARALTTSYIPNKNRLVMKISPEVLVESNIDKDTGYFSDKFIERYKNRKDKILNYAKNSELILDLTLVNYSVDRTFDHTKDDTITIEYKGFTKSFLNEPFCDILLNNKTKQKLADIEKATIDNLSNDQRYCDLKNIRKRISKHFEDMRKEKDENEAKRDTILEKLSRNGQIYTLNLSNEIINALSNNVDKKTKKILRPKDVHTLVSGAPINKLDGALPPVSNVIDKAKEINFFYFGDLIDVCMDFIYGDPKWYDGTTRAKRNLDRLRNDNGSVIPDIPEDNKISEIREKFANFPLKVILPTFFPTVYDSQSDSFDTSTKPEDKISIADIPIAVSYFQRWYDEEITDKKIKTYPLASFISRVLNSIVNNVLSDNCYNIGNIQRRYFNIRSDFGTFTGKNHPETNDNFFKQNYTNFDGLFNQYPGPFAKLEINNSPYLKKSTKIPRSKHCNYLVVYEQHSSLEPIGSINPKYSKLSNDSEKSNVYYIRDGLEKKNIPEFSPRKIEPYSNKETDFTDNMTFSKTQLPKAAEVRFYNDGFNELSSLAAVHDVSMDTSFLTTIYPGVLCWVEPDFIDGPEIYGSIPWTVGIGGFHLVTKVNHTFDVTAGRIEKEKTKIDAKFVDSGAGGAEVRYVECVDSATQQSFPNTSNAEEVE